MSIHLLQIEEEMDIFYRLIQRGISHNNPSATKFIANRSH